MTYDPKKYWEDRGKNYSVSFDTSEELENLKELCFQYSRGGHLFLDIGSGYGRIFKHLVDNKCLENKAYFMCDISESMICECKKQVGFEPLLWDGKCLPYLDNFFDWVISFSVMLHVPPKEIDRHFEETIRVSKKYIYIATYYGPKRGLAKHNFIHSYDLIIEDFNLQIVDRKIFRGGLRINWLLEKTK